MVYCDSCINSFRTGTIFYDDGDDDNKDNNNKEDEEERGLLGFLSIIS